VSDVVFGLLFFWLVGFLNMGRRRHVCQHVFLPQTVENEAFQYLSLSITAGELEANFPQQYDFGAVRFSLIKPNSQGLHLQKSCARFPVSFREGST